jgi:two-component system sensor histidine kinase CpxA
MKLFVRIFFGFWVTTVLMVAVVLSVSEFTSLPRPDDRETTFIPETVRIVLTDAVNAYENHGPAAMTSLLENSPSTHYRRVYIFDQTGRLLSGKENPPALFNHLAQDAIKTDQSQMRRYFGMRVLFISPVESSSGVRYGAVMSVFEPSRRLLSKRLWFNMGIAMFPMGLACMALSLYLTRPITRLRATAKRLAGGDLHARAVPSGTGRRDELGDLARDFDMMAARIQLLMTAQRRFLTDVSHELGAPLTRMHLALALLRRKTAQEDLAEVQRLEHETDRLSNLVQQLLLLASLEAGSFPAETMAPVSLNFIRNNVIEEASIEVSQAACKIIGSADETILLAYPQLLRRAVDNVVRNAIRYSPRDSEIDFDCHLEPDTQQVVFQIADHGPGVPEEMLSDIFLPFFRTAPGRERKTGGIGMGLAIASDAVRAHDGTISAANRKSGGLRITITLPMRTPEAGDESVRVEEPGVNS